jgi:uncharacterized membrane protein YphA (DoxX/SURF4 family)
LRGRGTLLAATRRRYFPGFFAALFLILLRTAIGWHFTVEGLAKFDEPFSAEGYFRNATGPLARYYRGLIPDGNGVERLTTDAQGLPENLKSRWAADLERHAAHYGFTTDQRQQAAQALADASAEADEWFRSRENRNKIEEYFGNLGRVMRTERDPNALASARKLASSERKKLETTRKELMAPIEGWTTTLRERWTALATDEQKARGPDVQPWTELDWINWGTKYGLVAAGIGLMAGLFTRLSALYGAVFLAMLYLAMPPWPGAPPAPGPGHDWIVNNHLIEALACLVLVALPTGQWIGLDALFFGWIGRRRAARLEGPDEHPYEPSPAEARRLDPVTRSTRR